MLNAYLRHHVEYAIQTCGPQNKRVVAALVALQQRATKFVSLLHGPYQHRLQALGLNGGQWPIVNSILRIKNTEAWHVLSDGRLAVNKIKAKIAIGNNQQLQIANLSEQFTLSFRYYPR